MNRRASLPQLAATMMWLLAGCSLVVSGEPTVRCQSDEGCPSDRRCATASGTCVDTADACTETSCSAGERCDKGTLRCVDGNEQPDGSDLPDASYPPDGSEAGTPDTGPVIPRIGDACASQTECTRVIKSGNTTVAGICATSPLSGYEVSPFCTVHCCNTSQCPSGFFCEHGPNAGRYCVPFGKDTREPPTGTKTPGASCEDDAECSTGRCDAADNSEPDVKTCLDTCCSDDDCDGSAGLLCGLRTGTSLQWVCRTPAGSSNPGSSCTRLSDCRHDACLGDVTGVCSVSCCSNASCTRAGSSLRRCVAAALDANGTIVNLCAADQDGGNADSECANDSQCQSGICVQARCASTCCTDADCGAQQRCVADGNEPRPHCASN